MLSWFARDELSRKLDDAIMSLLAVARTEDDVSSELMEISKMLSDAKRRLERLRGAGNGLTPGNGPASIAASMGADSQPKL